MTPTTPSAAVEAMARAICQEFYGTAWEATSPYRQGLCMGMASKALTALTTLHPGVADVLSGEAVIVPRECACPVDGSHIRTPQELQMFCAALSGITGNPEFFGSIMQQSPRAAVQFAAEVVYATQSASPYAPPAPAGEPA